MSDVFPEQADENFEGLILDQYAPRQIFVAEGEGARCLLDLFSNSVDATARGAHFFLLYADTASPGRCYAKSLKEIEFKHTEVYSARLQLMRNISAFSAALGPFDRAYLAGEVWFVEAVARLLRDTGLEQTQIMYERCPITSCKVTCSSCGTINIFEDPVGLCKCCATSLYVSPFFSTLTNSFFGLKNAISASTG